MPIRVIFLDWGDTLMIDDGAQAGPMVDWPRVTAVEGAREALCCLHPRYRLIVATNAVISNSHQVRGALARVSLDELVDDVVASCEIGSAKPEQAFFATLLNMASTTERIDACAAAMVGDSWTNDVCGALAAGLHAIWLNPSNVPVPEGGKTPDAVIRSMRDLPEAIAAIE